VSIREWIHAAITIAAVGQTLFVLLYLTAIRKWWRDVVAWSLFDKAVLLAVIFDLAVVAIWWSVNPVVFVVLYWLIAIAIWQQFGTLVWQRTARYRRCRRAGRE
jgi:hypothetical protein